MPPSSRSKAIPRNTINQAQSFLQDLPKREKESVSISEAVSGMADTVRAALAKGYSYNEVADILSDKLGIAVSAWSLRRYVPAGTRKNRKGEAAPKRGRRKKEEAEVAAEIATPTAVVEEAPAPVVEPTPEPTPEPAKTRKTSTRGKTATKAAAKAEPAPAPVEEKPAAKTRRTTTRGKAAAKPAAKTTRSTRKSK